ncbi:flavodoxin domain-containing protein [Colwellia psychrerythraea]|uniref:Flavodoxin/nitric oxide synthase n=1 Tax=Colwellia psychrerythraea TaxID=28229 RepID=A0A099KVZ7_COLPS|nr:flavodoxin domain-containing protein [Colwellia psychrerythraea]KGJ94741.1 flavodoxin/nitric oxide synthase [Colwellia psychrerythraea]
MSSIQIIVGSMLGGTEYVAEACEETLTKLDHHVDIHLKPDLQTILNNTFKANNEQNINSDLTKSPIWIVCTSTHGAGDYPDNIKQFVSDLCKCDQDLSTVRFLTIGIGDSSYDTFCKAAEDISKLLISMSCNEITSLKTFDMSEDIDPEDLAQQWISANKDLL